MPGLNKTAANETVEDLDAVLPEGWNPDDDFLNPDSWTGGAKAEKSTTSAQSAEDSEVDDPTEAVVEEKADSLTQDSTKEETSSTTEVDSTIDTASTDDEAEPSTPTIEQEAVAAPAKFKVPVVFDHETEEVELTESDLPGIVQKARVADRVQAKLTKIEEAQQIAIAAAKQLGFDSPEAMYEGLTKAKREQELEELTDAGVHPTVAEDLVNRKYPPMKAVQAETAPVEAKPAPDVGAGIRDFGAEVNELFAARPDLRDKPLPPEVVQACVGEGKSLLVAYKAWEVNEAKSAVTAAKQETAKLKKELTVEKQNSAAAVKAPVRGTAGGGAIDTKPEDLLLKGFDSDPW